MRRSTSVPLGRAYLAVASLAASAGLTAACGGDDDEEQVYCADENGVVVDDDNCDDDDRTGSRGYFLWVGPFGRGLRPGAKLTGGQRFAPGDAAARSRFGLSTSGPVANGTAVSGGFGSGKSGSGGG